MVEMESTKICCCGARICALAIGWLEAVGSTLLLIIGSIGFAHVKKELGKQNEGVVPGEERGGIPLVYSLFAVFVIVSIVQLVTASILITGVNQGNAGRVKVYVVSHVVLLVVGGIVLVVIVTLLELSSAITTIIRLLANIFFIWVTNLHRKDILASGGPTLAA